MLNAISNKSSLIAEKERCDDGLVISYCSRGKPYSYYNDDVWVLFALKSTVKFHNLSGNFKNAIKHIIYELIVTKTPTVSERTYAGNWIEGAITCQKIIIAIGGDDYSYIDSDAGYRKFISFAKTLNIRYKTWKNHLVIMSKLYKFGLIDRKIESSDSLARELSEKSKATQQSMAIPENIAAAYIRESMDVVEKYHPYRCEISEAYCDFINHYNHFKGMYRSTCNARRKAKEITKHAIPFEDFSLDLTGAWLSWLRGACYTLIASYTGCRDGEIKSFNLDSYAEEVYGDIPISIVTGVHTKPNDGGVERETAWVTAPVTQKAIELLWYSFEFAREIWRKESTRIDHEDLLSEFLKDIDSLFISLPYTTSKSPRAKPQVISKSLTSFSKSVGYEASSEDVAEFNMLNPTRKGELKLGQLLIPHPHGFRRTFAVFLVRNKLGSLINLKYQYKHINIAMTAWYSNQANLASYFDMIIDEELMSLIADENHNFMTDTLYYIYNEATTLSGKEGERIMSARDQSSASIYLSRDEISRQVKNGQMSIIENPFGHCTNPACSRICDMQTCKYKIVTKEKALSLLPVREKLVAKYKSLKEWNVKQPNIMSKIFYDIKSIDKSLSDHGIKFVPFDETISVSML